jgi:hypothetical protein
VRTDGLNERRDHVPSIPFPSLRYLQLKAKSIQERYSEGEPRARRLFRKHWRGTLPAPESLRLTDCYRVIASAFKCRDWATLKRGVQVLEGVRSGGNGSLSDADLDELVTMMGAHWQVSYWARQYVVEAKTRGYQAVLRGMKHRNAKVRLACSSYLDHYVTSWDPDTYRALEETMADRNADVRASVLHAMGCQRCKTDTVQDEAVDVFLRGLKDSSQKVRRTALAGLHQFRRDPRSVSAHTSALRDESFGVRKQAASGLGHYAKDPSVRDALLDVLATESHPEVVRVTLRSLNVDARGLVGHTRAEVEQRLGPALKTISQEDKPDAHFFPIEALSDSTRSRSVTGNWVRVLYDDSNTARAVTTHNALRVP